MRRVTSPSDLIPSRILPVPVQLRRSQRRLEFNSAAVEDLLQTDSLLVVGQAGAGKTSLAASIAAHELSRGRRTLFVRLSSWRHDETVIQLLGRLGGTQWADPQVGAQTIVLDAVDESRVATLDEAFDQVVALMLSLSPGVRIVVSCRMGGVPSWAYDDFDEVAEVHPLPLEVVRVELGPFFLAHLQPGSTAEPEVVEVCRNPMMLSLTSHIGGSELGRQRLQRVRSKSQLIMLYADMLIERDVTARRLGSGPSRLVSAGLAKLLLEKLALNLLKLRQTSVNDAQLELLCSEWLQGNDLATFFGGKTGNAPAVVELASAVKTLPLLNVMASKVLPTEVQFVHLNFRDVLGAAANSRDGINEETVQFPIEAQRWPIVVILAGLAERAGTVSSGVIDYGTAVKDQEYFRLGAQCVLERWDENGQRVDDLVLRVLDAFKNWGKPFDYELVRAARSLSSRLSANCPVRLSGDLSYFGDKYAPYRVELIASENPQRLFSYLRSTDRQLRRDALYSIPHHVKSGHLDADFCASALWRVVRSTADPHDLEIAVAAFKSLAETFPSSVEQFAVALAAETPRVSSISWRATAFLLNSLAYVGDESAVELIGQQLLNPANRYRDSASWSLLIHTRRHMSNRIVYDKAVQFYRDAVGGPKNILHDAYAMGNVLYSIGELKISELRGAVVAACRRPEGYVREDAVFALGLLNDDQSANDVATLLFDNDPGVRLKAVEAAGVIHDAAIEAQLRVIVASKNELPYIRSVAVTALGFYSRDKEGETLRLLFSTRRRRDSRTAIVGPLSRSQRDVVRALLEQAVTANGAPRDFRERAIGDDFEFIVSNDILEHIERLL